MENQSFTGGILAQPSNIGHYSSDVFSAVPELDVTVGYLVTSRLRATFGYTFIYWTRVARPDDAIDLQLNPDQFPPAADPITGPLRPAFVFRDSSFWAQGLRFGVDYRW